MEVLVFPVISLGSGGANEIGGKYNFAGRSNQAQQLAAAVFMDFGVELGEQGFRKILRRAYARRTEPNRELT